MLEHYDIAIAGAGPAGAMLARELAHRCPHKRVLLIDGQSEARKKPCGGLLSPSAQKVLAQFDLTLPNDILSDPQIFTVETIDLVTRRVRYYQRHYLNMDRYRFDRWLLSLVPSNVTILCGRVGDVVRQEDGFCLTLGEQKLCATYLVGADGADSLIRRRLIGKMPRRYISIQEWYVREGKGLPYYSCIFDSETSDSCSWTIHKDGYMIFGGAFEMPGCREAYEKQKERLSAHMGLSLGSAVKREACLVASPRRMRDFCLGKEGVFLVGEAAGLISASSFEGISSALLSGKLLAEAFADGGDILRRYQSKTRPLRAKLTLKFFKRAVLCNPFLRRLIMKSGITSIRMEKGV